MPHSRTIRLERHERIGQVIQSDVVVLVNRWSRRAVEEQPDARRVHHAVLLNQLPAFLWALGSSLSESAEDKVGKHQIPAIQHGEQRWESGWSLPELIRDYQLLRTVVIEYLGEVLDRPLLTREILAINLAFDESIAASVGMYVASREDAIRQAERARAVRESQAEEERLRHQAEALKDVSRRKDEFLAVLGHELRNPLAPLRTAVQILSLKGDDPEVVAQARDMLDRQTAQLTRLVDELLDASRIAQGKAQLKRERLDLAALVRATTSDRRAELEAAKLALQVEIPQRPVWVEGDAARLTQVVGNLLHNASKFTDPGGRVTVRLSEEDSLATLTIEDTGIGLAPEVLPRLFETFSQVDSTLERSKGGLGLGLAIVKGLVELHGGRVRAASAGPNRGALFTVWLPLHRGEQVVPAQVAAAPALPGVGRKVLIIEDNHDAAGSLRLLLSLHGFEVAVTADGGEGVQQARQVRPHAVVCDLGLPGMNGFEVARTLRADPVTGSALLVCVSGYGQEQDLQHAREAGFDATLVKPVDPDALIHLLTRARDNLAR
ncbi:MAG TPA: ATP-binding protein [Gemmataceae bacterium]|nr:ATP-binding protein [Gemmataceae bacterium]